MRNTLLLSLYSILWGFPVPILFALLLNELRDGLFKRAVQTVSYLPHFISVVVLCGMVIQFLSPGDGIVNRMISTLGGKPVAFLTEPGWFRTVYVATGIWRNFGWNSIIFLAAMTGVDPQLYEAARLDGAGRMRLIGQITLPAIMPTVLVLLILDLGSLMSVGYEKIILLYNPVTYETADVISTYIYRRGIVQSAYSLGAAVGLFNSAINCLLLVIVNRLSRRLTEVGLW
jgi:putative aldouronate transport system permease protein